MNKQKDKNNVLVSIVIVLLIIIAILGFFLGKNYNNNTGGGSESNVTKNIKIKVIDDKRCSECQSDQIISQLKLIPTLSNVEVEEKDFADKGVEEYLKENDINLLPAIIFNENNVDSNINSYLSELPSKEYSLQIGATFNPFLERSDKGFTILDKEKIKEIKEDALIKGNTDAEITWLEYSDLECPYCAKLHNAGTPEDLAKKYGNKLNIIFNHFPLPFHNNALPGAQIAECLGEQKGNEAFYALIEKSFSEENSSKKFLIAEAVKLGANEDTIKECLSSDKYEEKVKKQENTGKNLFGITGTPGNVLINNKTGEYQVISGAYPTSAFEEVIDKLLSE